MSGNQGNRRAIVIGGGAAGTAAAFRLKQAGAEVLLVERENRLGGRMRTEQVDGFVVDIGAGILPGTYAAVHQLMRDAGLSDLLDELTAPIAIMRERRMHYLDGNAVAAIAKTRLLGVAAKLRLAALPPKLLSMWSSLDFENLGRAARYDTESLGTYGERVLGAEVMQYLLGPLVKTMYSMSAENASVVDFFWCAKNLLAAKTYSIRGGMEAMPTALATTLDQVRLSTECLGVRESADGVEVTLRDATGRERVEHADVCVLATRARDVTALHPGLSAAASAALAQLRFSATAEIHLLLSAPTDEKAAVVMIPDAEDRDIATISFVHNRGLGRVPPGKGAVSVYFHERWARETRTLSDTELYEAGMAKLARLFPQVPPLVERHLVQRWDVVATLSHPGYWRNVGLLVDALNFDSRIQLAGDYFALACVNTAVTSGELAARRLRQYLS